MTEEETFARFHALRKHNSTKRERVEAWRAVEAILWRRTVQSMRTHPIAPGHRWWDFNDSAPPGWTYPSSRSVEPDEVDECFPGALVAFATQCDDIPCSRFIVVVDRVARLRLSVPMSPGFDTKHANVVWLPTVGIWRRYSTSVSTKPHTEMI